MAGVLAIDHRRQTLNMQNLQSTRVGVHTIQEKAEMERWMMGKKILATEN